MGALTIIERPTRIDRQNGIEQCVTILNLVNEDENCQTSMIYYMELVDENPDSNETVRSC